MYKKTFFIIFISIVAISIIFYYRYEHYNENRADAALQSGYMNYKNHKPFQAMGDFSFLADYYGNRRNKIIKQIVAKGLLKKAEILTEVNDIDSAILVYEQLSNLYINEKNNKLRKDIATARFMEGNLLLQQKRYSEAMIPYSYLVSAYSNDSSLYIQKMIAQVMYNETIILTATKHADTALNIDSAIIERFINSKVPEIRLIVAQSLMARTKNRLDKKEWAIALYNSNAFIRLFKNDQIPAIEKYLIKNLLYRAEILHKVTQITKEERPIFGNDPQKEALQTYDDALQKIENNHDNNKDSDYLYYQAIALLGKAQILNNNQKADEALTLCNKIYDLFHQNENIKIHAIVAGSLFTKGQIETKQNKLSQAELTYNTLLTLYQPNSDPAQRNLNETIINTYLNQSILVQKLTDNESAIKLLSKVMDLYRTTPDEKLYYKLSNAILYKAELLTKMKEYDQALTTYTGFIAVAHHKNYLDTRYNGAIAITQKARLLILMNKGKEAGQTFEQLSNFYLDDQNIKIRRVVAQGMYEHAEGLFENNRGYIALNTINMIFEHFEKNKNDPEVKEILDKTQELRQQLDASIAI